MTSVGASARYDDETARALVADGHWGTQIPYAFLEHWAQATPDTPYAGDRAGALTYGQCLALASRLAAALLSLGVKPGDRVLAQLPNWREFALVYLAVSRVGAILVPVQPIYRDNEISYIIDRTEAKVGFWTPEFRSHDHLHMQRRLRPVTPSLTHSILVRADLRLDLASHELRFEELVGEADDLAVSEVPVRRPSPDDGHLICFTSGTESRPKGCYHTFNTYGFCARKLAEPEFMDVRPGNAVLMPSPVTHTTGLNTGIILPLITGAQTVLMDTWDPALALDAIGTHQCTHGVGAPTFLRTLLDAYDQQTHSLASMRLWLCGGAPIHPQLAADAAAAGVAMMPCYGATEVLVTTVCRRTDSLDRLLNSDGRALDGVDLKIVAPDGEDAPLGSEGEILHRGPGLMLGYWRDPQLTDQTIDSAGYCHSGDLGRMDADGYIRVTGRLKDIIIRGGVNISVRSVEEHLLAHPKIRQAAVVAMPDPVLGERACAFVVPRNEAPTLQELCAWLRDERRIAIQYQPEHLVVVEKLPMTESGKIQKAVLRQMAQNNSVSADRKG